MSKPLGNYAEDTTALNFNFNTRTLAQVPITLAGAPSLEVYKNSTTQSTAGITLTVDYDGKIGLHHVVIDLSSDAFYAAGEDYSVVIAAGTVDGISVVGTEIAYFSIQNRIIRTTHPMVKNSGGPFYFDMTDASGTYMAGKTVAVERSLDAETFESASGTITEVGSGAYHFAPSAADINCNAGAYRFSASGCRDTLVYVNPQG